MESSYKKTLKWMSKTDRRRLYTLDMMSRYKNSFNVYDIILREISDRPAVSIVQNAMANTTVSVSIVDRLAEIRDRSMSVLEFMATHRWTSYRNLLGKKTRTVVLKDEWEDSIYGYSRNQHLECDLYELSAITNKSKYNLRWYVNELEFKS